MTTPPPTTPGLPTTITYAQVQQAITTLLPNTPILRVLGVLITADAVVVRWYDGTGEHSTPIPTTHAQGAYTEGGENDD